MTTTSHRGRRYKGKRRERQSGAIYEELGFYTFYSSASAGLWDVACFGTETNVLIQVKSRDWPHGMEMEMLRAFKAAPDTRKEIHRWRDGVGVPDIKVIP